MYKFKFADIGEGLHEGVVSDVLVKVGDKIKKGMDLFIVETAKITSEISSPVDGIIKEVLIDKGKLIKVGDVVIVIDDNKKTKFDKSEKKGASVVGEVNVSDDIIPLFGSQSKKIKKSINKNNFIVTNDIKILAEENKKKVK